MANQMEVWALGFRTFWVILWMILDVFSGYESSYALLQGDSTSLLATTCNNLGCYYKKAWGRRQLSHVVPNFFGDFWQVGKFHGALSYLRRALKLEASSGLVELWTKLPQLGKFDLCHVAGSKISRTCWKPQWMVHSCWVSHPFWTAHIHWWYQKANNDRACTMIRWLIERIQYNSNGTYISDREHMIYDN